MGFLLRLKRTRPIAITAVAITAAIPAMIAMGKPFSFGFCKIVVLWVGEGDAVGESAAVEFVAVRVVVGVAVGAVVASGVEVGDSLGVAETTGLTVMLLLVAAIAGKSESVTVIVWDPTVFSVMSKVPVPAIRLQFAFAV